MLRQTRNTYQHGWIETQPSKNKELVFVYRWRERKPDGGCTKRAAVIGRVSVLKTEANAWRAIEHRALEISSENLEGRIVSFGALINRYLEEDLPELRHSTAEAYRSYLDNRIMPRWGSYSIAKVKPFAVEQWLKELDLAPKTKGHLHNLMRVLFNCAMRWELIHIGENPMKLVRVRGTSKREQEPTVITVIQFHRLLKELDEPFRTMAILDLATGLRCSELFALKWCDVVWDDLVLLVRRAIVDGVVSDVKTKYSKAGMPLDPGLAEMLLNWQRRTLFKKPEDWVFASPYKAGTMPWRSWGVQQRRLAPAGIRCGIGRIGWHTFRHTFRSLLDETGAPMKVQQELMRHADIRTTMNVYGRAMDTSKREAHSKVVRLVLPSESVSAL
jgi:integrase